jgi:Flp pilus assembly protein TadG
MQFSLALAALGAAFAVGLALQRRRRLRMLAPVGARSLARLARTLPDLAALAAHVPTTASAPVRAIVEAAITAETTARARVDVDEVLADVDAGLARASASTLPEVRVSVMVGTLAALLEVIAGLGSGQSTVAHAVTAVVTGIAGGVVASLAGRLARRDVVAYREDYDALVGALERWLRRDASGPGSGEVPDRTRANG